MTPRDAESNCLIDRDPLHHDHPERWETTSEVLFWLGVWILVVPLILIAGLALKAKDLLTGGRKCSPVSESSSSSR